MKMIKKEINRKKMILIDIFNQSSLRVVPIGGAILFKNSCNQGLSLLSGIDSNIPCGDVILTELIGMISRQYFNLNKNNELPAPTVSDNSRRAYEIQEELIMNKKENYVMSKSGVNLGNSGGILTFGIGLGVLGALAVRAVFGKSESDRMILDRTGVLGTSETIVAPRKTVSVKGSKYVVVCENIDVILIKLIKKTLTDPEAKCRQRFFSAFITSACEEDRYGNTWRKFLPKDPTGLEDLMRKYDFYGDYKKKLSEVVSVVGKIDFSSIKERYRFRAERKEKHTKAEKRVRC